MLVIEKHDVLDIGFYFGDDLSWLNSIWRIHMLSERLLFMNFQKFLQIWVNLTFFEELIHGLFISFDFLNQDTGNFFDRIKNGIFDILKQLKFIEGCCDFADMPLTDTFSADHGNFGVHTVQLIVDKYDFLNHFCIQY